MNRVQVRDRSSLSRVPRAGPWLVAPRSVGEDVADLRLRQRPSGEKERVGLGGERRANRPPLHARRSDGWRWHAHERGDRIPRVVEAVVDHAHDVHAAHDGEDAGQDALARRKRGWARPVIGANTAIQSVGKIGAAARSGGGRAWVARRRGCAGRREGGRRRATHVSRVAWRMWAMFLPRCASRPSLCAPASARAMTQAEFTCLAVTSACRQASASERDRGSAAAEAPARRAVRAAAAEWPPGAAGTARPGLARSAPRFWAAS